MVLRSSVGEKIAKDIIMFKKLQQEESGDVAGLLASIQEHEEKLKVHNEEVNYMQQVKMYDAKTRKARQTCPDFSSIFFLIFRNFRGISGGR
jgi:hypothetical protein